MSVFSQERAKRERLAGKTATPVYVTADNGRVQSVRVQKHVSPMTVLGLDRRHLLVRVGTGVLQGQNVSAMPVRNARGS